MNQKVVIVELAAEGGGATVFGQEVDGVWSFTQEQTSMDIDDDANEEWLTRTSGSFANLTDALPEHWRKLYPIEVHPEFKAKLLAEFERQREDPGEPSRPSQRERWLRFLSDC